MCEFYMAMMEKTIILETANEKGGLQPQDPELLQRNESVLRSLAQ